jgi:hypothetical protein
MMKLHARKPLAMRSLLAIVMGAALFSFSERPGVESFTIYLNDEVLVRDSMMPERVVRNISLEAGDPKDVLRVHYNHCGRTGMARAVSVLGANEEVLKTWRFSDNTSPFMEIGLKDILAVAGNGQEPFNLVYTSKELPKGSVLASLQVKDSSKASLR